MIDLVGARCLLDACLEQLGDQGRVTLPACRLHNLANEPAEHAVLAAAYLLHLYTGEQENVR